MRRREILSKFFSTILLIQIIIPTNLGQLLTTPAPFSKRGELKKDLNPCTNSEASSSCSACIQADPNCAWSEELITNGPQCFYRGMQTTQSNEDRIKFYKPSVQVVRTSAANEYIKPEKLRAKVRPGSSVEMTIEFVVHDSYPVDLYYLTDLSGSMRDYIKTVEVESRKISRDLQNAMGSNAALQVGVGSFIEKPVAPFTNIGDQHVFQNWAKLASAKTSGRKIEDIFNKFTQENQDGSHVYLRNNADTEEAGLEALVQVARCSKEIGWDPKARHIVVYSSDAIAHLAGAGRLAGINQPNDLKCDLKREQGKDVYMGGLKQDYPSVKDIKQVLADANIQMIVSTTDHQGRGEDIIHFYQNLTEYLGADENKVGLWKSKDSKSKVSDIIVDAYNKMTEYIRVEMTGLPKEYKVNIKAICEGVPMPNSNKCLNPKKSGKTVQFRFEIELPLGEKCPEKATAIIRTPGYGGTEHVQLEIEAICSCEDCKTQNTICKRGKQECSGHGKWECGKCICDEGYAGQCCDCDLKQTNTDACIAPGGQAICSGRGTCQCGKCVCDKSHFNFNMGEFCECDTTQCPIHNGTMCAGHGECVCNKAFGAQCDCNRDWTGDACQCTKKQHSCQTRSGLCAGRGDCECNKCKCWKHEQGSESEAAEMWKFEENCETLWVDCDGLEGCKDGSDCIATRADVVQGGASSVCTYASGNCNCKTSNICKEPTLTFFVNSEKQLMYTSEMSDICNYVDIKPILFGTFATTLILGLLIILLGKLIVWLLDKKEDKKLITDTGTMSRSRSTTRTGFTRGGTMPEDQLLMTEPSGGKIVQEYSY